MIINELIAFFLPSEFLQYFFADVRIYPIAKIMIIGHRETLLMALLKDCLIAMSFDFVF